MHRIRKPYHPLYVANYVITYCEENGLELNNLKLQKILYFLQAKSLLETGSPLFNEALQKWKYGPVSPTVYHEYKNHGASTIDTSDIGEILREPYPDEEPNFFGMYVKETFDLDFILIDDRNELKEPIKNLAMYDAFDLVDETHAHSIWKDYEIEINEGVQGLQYSEEEIKAYFLSNPDRRIWEK